MRVERDRVLLFVACHAALASSRHVDPRIEQPVVCHDSTRQPLQIGTLGIDGDRLHDLPARRIGLLGEFGCLPRLEAFRKLLGRECLERRDQGFVSQPVPFDRLLCRSRIGVDHASSMRSPRERRGQRVVIHLRERVVFVIVTADTAER